MVPYSPGISLLLPEDTKITLQNYQERYSSWEPYLLHENYEGGQDDYKPGWNYLNFRSGLVPDTFIWITEKEKPYPASYPKTSHLNTATRISGMIFNLEESALSRLSELVDSPLQSGTLDLGGVTLYTQDALLLEKKHQHKEFPLAAVLLRADNLDFFHQLDPPPPTVNVLGETAVYLEMPPQCWDLIITPRH
jgi:hypothetical protein